jgi:hypothetical protein
MVMTQALTNLEVARLLISKLSDTDKLALLSDQLEGDLCFDSQDAMDATCDLYDAFRACFDSLQEAIEADLIEPDDDYDGGRWDFATSRGLRSAAA